jgi:hypothetical protein
MQTDRQAERLAGRQADRQTSRQADRQTGRQTKKQTSRQADRKTGKAYRQTDRVTDLGHVGDLLECQLLSV